MSSADAIYLDFNATTPVAPEVLEAMLPALREHWGNPSSDHAWGRRARAVIETARAQVAALVGAAPDEVVFTGGGTEADNAAVLGVATALEHRGRHLVISAIEHPAVAAAAAALERRGFRVSRVAPGPEGAVDPDAVEAAFAPDTTLVSVMHANNETGVIQPVREIARRARRREIVVHTDAAQSVGKLPVRLDDLGADLLTIAGHKLHAPKGIGALVRARGAPCASLLVGGSHESGRRAGTENTAGIVGLGAACALAGAELERRRERLERRRERLEAGLARRLPGLVIHGARAARLPNTTSVAFPGVDAAALLAVLPNLAASTGAACHARGRQPSAVLTAMGVPDELALSTLRLSVGRSTTAEEIDRAVGLIARGIERA